MLEGIRGLGGEHGLVLIKVDPDLEGCGEAADRGVSRASSGDRQEVATNSRNSGDCGRGGGVVLEGGNLEIVSERHLVIIDGIEGCHPGADGAHRGGLGGLHGGGADPIRGLGGGGGDVGAVADRAVAPGPPDADVVILVTQMGLGGGDGGCGGVPIETGDGPLIMTFS